MRLGSSAAIWVFGEAKLGNQPGAKPDKREKWSEVCLAVTAVCCSMRSALDRAGGLLLQLKRDVVEVDSALTSKLALKVNGSDVAGHRE